MELLNFSPDAILDSELKPTGSKYTNHKVNKGFVFQWHQVPQATARISAHARELMTSTFLGKFTTLTTYDVGSQWKCTEVTSPSGKPSGVFFYINLHKATTATVEAFVKNLRESSPLSVLTSFAFNMTPKISVVPQVNGTTSVYCILPSDRGILLDVGNNFTPDGVSVDWRYGFYSVDPELPLERTVVGRAALTLAGLREQGYYAS